VVCDRTVMYLPAEDDEITTLVAYADQQLAAIRACTLGLTEEQARQRPCRSALSLAGIVKHTGYGLEGALARFPAEPAAEPVLDGEAFAAYAASFVLTADETVRALLDDFDRSRAAFLVVAAAVDPDGQTLAPPAPWMGVMESRPIRWRYHLGHLVEEFARHAGHADIIREQLDGQAVPALMMTLEGVPANAFFQPYVPAPGTIGASG
jgi:hypothetical protein